MPDTDQGNADSAAMSAVQTKLRDTSTSDGVNYGTFKVRVLGVGVFPARYKAIWSTASDIFVGPHGKFPVTFYQCILDFGQYRALGDLIAQPADRMQSAGQTHPLAGGAFMLFGPGDKNAWQFKEPVGFDRLLSDAGSRNPNDVVYWRMRPPIGYRALGICFTNGEQPNPKYYWCVHESILRRVGTTQAWSDEGAAFEEANGILLRPVFDQPLQLDEGQFVMLPPTYLSAQDIANESAWALAGQQALLDVAPIPTPDPPNDSSIVSGATTNYGLGKVAIVPYTAVPGDAGLQDQGWQSPFYYIASMPYWTCIDTESTPSGGNRQVTRTVGTSSTDSSSFTNATSLTVGANVGAGYGGFGASVSVSYTQAFSLTKASSTTTDTQFQETVSIPFPAQPITCVWERRTELVMFRTDMSVVSQITYANRDQRLLPTTPATTHPATGTSASAPAAS